MPKKLKIEVDYVIGDKVIFVTDETDVMPAIITQIVLSDKEAQYMVARGMEEKLCYANEIELVKHD